MTTPRTVRACLAGVATAVALWFVAGALQVALERTGVSWGLIGFVAPVTSATSLVRGQDDGSAVAALVALALVTGALLVVPARAAVTGFAPRVLAAWFAVIAGGAAAAAVDAAVYWARWGGEGDAWSSLVLLDGFGVVRAAGAWGVTYGWAAALVTVLVARSGASPAPDVAEPAGARVAAGVAGLLAGGGWLVVATAHEAVRRTVEEHVTTSRSHAAAQVSMASDWVFPVTTTRGASGGVVLGCAVLVGLVVAALTWLGARRSVVPGGRWVLGLGVWAACAVGALVGAVPSLLATTGLDPVQDGWWFVGQRLLIGPTDGGASGAIYGWLTAAAVALVLTLADRRARPGSLPDVAERTSEPV